MIHRFIYDSEKFTYYDYDDIGFICKHIIKPIVKKGKVQYYNIPCAFDIENTSTIVNDEKTALMYMWSFAICDYVIIGRTWQQFVELIQMLVEKLVLYKNRHLVCYIHNFSFEFQWFRKWFKWEKVFSLDKRKPILGITTQGIEFRCSYALSGYSLANLSNTIPNTKYKKLVGVLDYEKIRHTATILQCNEKAYSIRDVQVIIEYISHKIKTDGNITKIPMTKTGYVRRVCRQACYGVSHRDEQATKYLELMKKLTITPEEYTLLKDAFQGGFTHANPYKVRKCDMGYDGKHYIENVGGFDITSDYPTEMICENQYPMSKGKFITVKNKAQFEALIKKYFCVFDITFYDLQDKVFIDNPLSKSRCIEITKDAVINNGRVVSCSKCRCTITHIDFEIYKACYDIKDFKINKLIRYIKGYLPTPFVKQVLQFYKDKTTLKGVDGLENVTQYQWSKELLNATFGCCVTDPCQPEIVYDEFSEDVFIDNQVDKGKAIAQYNASKKRFLFYPWGVAITALARRRLWGLILACGSDYCYADTDSVKVQNPEKYLHFFKKSDKIITDKLKRAAEYHDIPWEDIAPKNIKGESKQLGLWELEAIYTKFRTNGAKRYLYELENGKVNLTVSGLNKYKAIPYLFQTYGKTENVFANFNTGLKVPPPYSGRMVATYIDYPTGGIITDYNGVTHEWTEKSSVCLLGGSYTMDYSKEYEKYKGVLDILFNDVSTEFIYEKERLKIE